MQFIRCLGSNQLKARLPVGKAHLLRLHLAIRIPPTQQTSCCLEVCELPLLGLLRRQVMPIVEATVLVGDEDDAPHPVRFFQKGEATCCSTGKDLSIANRLS